MGGGADVDLCGANGGSAMLKAAARGDAASVSSFLAAQCDVNQATDDSANQAQWPARALRSQPFARRHFARPRPAHVLVDLCTS